MSQNAVEALNTVANLSLLPEVDLSVIYARMKWLETARDDQLPPENMHEYFTWLLLGGRGSGKTRSGAEEIAYSCARRQLRVALIGPTNNDVRKTMFEGESGLLNVIPKDFIDNYNRTSLELWTKNGSYLVGYSGEEPERLRGPQHHIAWCDELAAWRYLQETWDQMSFGLRLGEHPYTIVTTTPKPVGLVRELVKSSDTFVAKATTYDNATNLPKKILQKLKEKYEGTRLGRQELNAEIISDNPFALWNREMIDSSRATQVPELSRVVVAVDPPITTGEKADECGIVVAGSAWIGAREEFFVMRDSSVQGLSPEGWAREATQAYNLYQADRIVAEVNQGGDMVESVMRNVEPNIAVTKVHATRGKVVRAEPIAALYEQGRVHHVGQHGTLEDQMCDFTSDFDKKVMGYSPDRVDALVWALTELSEGVGGVGSRSM